MKNVKALMKLDWELIKSFRIWLAVFLAIAVAVTLINQTGIVFIVIWVGVFSALIMAWQFEVTDKNNLNVLYAALPTTRKSMVFARYMFALIFLASAIVIGLVVGLGVELIFGNEIVFDIIFMIMSLSIGIFFLMVAWQNVFFFKLGYTKGRMFVWVPLTIFIILLNLPVLLGIFNVTISMDQIFMEIFANTWLVSGIALVIGVTAFVASYFASCRTYLKKDI